MPIFAALWLTCVSFASAVGEEKGKGKIVWYVTFLFGDYYSNASFISHTLVVYIRPRYSCCMFVVIHIIFWYRSTSRSMSFVTRKRKICASLARRVAIYFSAANSGVSSSFTGVCLYLWSRKQESLPKANLFGNRKDQESGSLRKIARRHELYRNPRKH